MQIIPYVKSQYDLLTDILLTTRDQPGTRWRDREIYHGLNQGIQRLAQTARTPRLYSISWDGNSYEYTLPNYIELPITPQQKVLDWDYRVLTGEDTDMQQWRDIVAFDVEPNSSGSWTLKLHYLPIQSDGRVVYWGSNGLVPTTVATLASNIDADDTSLTLNCVAPQVGRTGWVKIDNEWISYANVAYASGAITLQNLVRGALFTTADTHAATVNVYFGVAVHQPEVWQVLHHFALAAICQMYTLDSSAKQQEHYFNNARYYQQLAEEGMRRLTPARSPQIRLHRGAIGPAGGLRWPVISN